MSIVRSLSRISYLPFVGFVSAYGAYNASLKILNDENATWNELDVEQALKAEFQMFLFGDALGDGNILCILQGWHRIL